MSAEIRVFVSTTPGSLERKKMMERTVNVIRGLASRMDYTVGTMKTRVTPDFNGTRCKGITDSSKLS